MKFYFISTSFFVSLLLWPFTASDHCHLNILFNIYFCSSFSFIQPDSKSTHSNQQHSINRWSWDRLERQCCELRRCESCIFQRIRPECLIRLQVLLLATQYQYQDRRKTNFLGLGSRWADCEHFNHRNCSKMVPLWLLLAVCILVFVVFVALATLNAYSKYKKIIYVDI